MNKKSLFFTSLVLFILLAFFLELGFSHKDIPEQWQWANSIVFWFVLIAPSIVGVLAVIVFQQTRTGILSRIAVVLEATVVALVANAFVSSFFFAHDAPNNLSRLTFITRMLSNPFFLGLWFFIALLGVLLHYLFVKNSNATSSIERPLTMKVKNVVTLLAVFIAGFVFCLLFFRNAILNEVTPGTFTGGFDSYSVSPSAGFFFADKLACTVIHSTTNQFPIKEFTVKQLNTNEPIVLYPSGISEPMKKLYDDASYVVLQAPVTVANVETLTIQKKDGLLAVALSWEQAGKYLFSGAQKGKCRNIP